jgi:hypothetical protein
LAAARRANIARAHWQMEVCALRDALKDLHRKIAAAHRQTKDG